MACRSLTSPQVTSLARSIRHTLKKAIELGSTMPLSFDRSGNQDGLFYFGSAGEGPTEREERFQVYDRDEQPCRKCRTQIERIVLGGRSTFFCPSCQPGQRTPRSS